MCCCVSGCQVCCRKSWTLILAIFENLCFAGCVYGWPSLADVFGKIGYFDTCNDTTTYANETHMPIEEKICPDQETSFNLIFTLASFSTSLSTLPNGLLFDKAGTMVTKIYASILFLGAFLMLIFSSPTRSFLVYPAMIMWGFGGCALLITNFQVANFFGAKRSTVITLLSATFDSSAVMMLIIRFSYDSGVSLKIMFVILVCASLLFNINTFFLLPKSHIPYPLPADYFYKNSSKSMEELGLQPVPSPKSGGLPNGNASRLHGYYEAYNVSLDVRQRSNKVGVKPESTGQPAKKTSDDYNIVYDSPDSGLGISSYNNMESVEEPSKEIPSLTKCILSGLFFSHLVWMSILQHRNWFYLGSFKPWITFLATEDDDPSMTTKEKVADYTTIFGFIQLGAIFVGPLCGLIVDRNKNKTFKKTWERGSWRIQRVRGPYSDLEDTVLALIITSTLSVLFSICVVIPILPVQYASFVLQVILRSFVYGLNAAFIATAFPVEHLGTLLGLDLALAAMFGLIQFPLFKLTQSVFDEDPFYINVALLVLNFVSYAHPIYVAWYCRREKRRLEMEEYEKICRKRDAEELKVVNRISTV